MPATMGSESPLRPLRIWLLRNVGRPREWGRGTASATSELLIPDGPFYIVAMSEIHEHWNTRNTPLTAAMGLILSWPASA